MRMYDGTVLFLFLQKVGLTDLLSRPSLFSAVGTDNIASDHMRVCSE